MTSQKLTVPNLKYNQEIVVKTTADLIKMKKEKKLKVAPYQRPPKAWKDHQIQELYLTVISGEKLPAIDARRENGALLIEEGHQRTENTFDLALGKKGKEIKKISKSSQKYRNATAQEQIYYDSFGGMKIKDLPKEIKQKILDYPFVFSITDANEEDGVKYYRRSNTLGARLSKAETKRAFHFHGVFYKEIQKKAKKLEVFYEEYEILSEHDINRLGGQLLTADSVILSLEGPVGSSKLDVYYTQWTLSFINKDRAFSKLDKAISTIKKMYPDGFPKNSKLNKPISFV